MLGLRAGYWESAKPPLNFSYFNPSLSYETRYIGLGAGPSHGVTVFTTGNG